MSQELSDVKPLDWDEFRAHMAEKWSAGEHVAVVAPTGAGKSTVALGLLKMRRWVLAFDLKGGDKTISSTGWPRLKKWPPTKEQREKIAKGEPLRLIVGSAGRKPEHRAARTRLHAQVLQAVMQEGGWTIYMPDLKVLTNRAFGGLADEVTELLILARDAGVSVVTDFQRPSGVPMEAGDQATYMLVSYIRDEKAVQRMSEMMARSPAEMRGAIAALGRGRYTWLMVSRDPYEPLIVTRSRKA